MAKKTTKRENISNLLNIAEVRNNPELVDFLNHELELLDRKSASNSKTSTQKENEILVEMVFTELENLARPVTATELLNESEILKNHVLENGKTISNQKITALLTKLVNAQRVVRTTEKKKSFFSVA